MPPQFSPGTPPRRILAVALLTGGLLFPSTGFSADPITSLVAVRPDGSSGSFLLVCDGTFLYSRTEDPDPRRVVLDLPKVRNSVKERKISPDSDLVRTISISGTGKGNEQEGTRVVFELKRPCPVSLHPKGDTLAVVLDAASKPEAAVMERDPSPVPAVPVVGRAAPVRVGNLALPPSADYVIGSEDLLEISVFEQPDLTRTVRVSGDGTIRIPLVGVIPVIGLTTQGAEAKLRDLLEEKYLTDPQVSVFVKEAKS
ncbi:MAG TPA: polysaccharide biosynthesis/export family protein, partial [Candidatus Polarisedimenticolia bacterium]|nr:polysaccharide biosynthesis/export family protein [Candidatus Polarisedimenticolia bacterium]